MVIPEKDVPILKTKSASPRKAMTSIPIGTTCTPIPDPKVPSQTRGRKKAAPANTTLPGGAKGSFQPTTQNKEKPTSPSVSGHARKTAVSNSSSAAVDRDVLYRSPRAVKPIKPSIDRQLSIEDIATIEKNTRGQRENNEWFKWRQNRITASLAHQISHSRYANQKSTEIPQSYLKAILGSGSRVQTAAMNWGIRNEKNAVRAYERLTLQRTGKEVKVDDCGLFIQAEKNWLAASPDGIVRDVRTGENLCVLEVKCPYKHREHNIRESCADRQFCLKMDGDTYQLKTDHPYYTQVQCQLAVTKMVCADFVVYTNKEVAIVPVRFDPKFWKETEVKLERFYFDAVIPKENGMGSSGKGLTENDVWAVEE
ncbi:uncharacterized protein RCH25_043846 [Pelodytes ibericus]